MTGHEQNDLRPIALRMVIRQLEMSTSEAEHNDVVMPEDDLCEQYSDDYLRTFLEYQDGLYDYRHGFPFMERVFGKVWERLNIFEREGWDIRRKAYCLGWVDARIEEELLGIKDMDIRYTRPVPVPPVAWWLDEDGSPF
mgnify:CR=1 FL=1